MGEESLPRCEFEASKLLLKLQITLSANVNAISPVVQGVMTAMREMTCGRGKEFEVETALREALANAVLHGCQGNPDCHVQVCVACDATRGILIVVRDPGSGFDPEALPSPILGQQVFAEHGRGIFLINQMMDKVRFERGGTEIHMLKRGTGASTNA
jgi:serine/threonine-protein kinase RsbW